MNKAYKVRFANKNDSIKGWYTITTADDYIALMDFVNNTAIRSNCVVDFVKEICIPESIDKYLDDQNIQVVTSQELSMKFNIELIDATEYLVAKSKLVSKARCS